MAVKNIMLCYGITVSAPYWAKRVGVKYGELKAQKCGFCKTKPVEEAHFCHNCGNELAIGPDEITSVEVVEQTVIKLGPPPNGIRLLAGEEEVHVAMVLAEDSGNMASWDRDPSKWSWREVGRAISNYVQFEISEIGDFEEGPKPRLFVFRLN